jgi:hypothetical protein
MSSSHREPIPPGQSEPGELPVEPDSGPVPLEGPMEEAPTHEPLPRIPV